MPIIDLPDAPAPFATPAELASYLQRSAFTGDELTRAELLLDLASAAMRVYTGRTLSAVVGDTVVLDGTYSALLRLPNYPVTTLTSITAEGILVPSTDYLLYADAGMVRRTTGWGWGWTYGGVTVVYSHGYAEGSAEMLTLKGICLGLASATLGNPDNLKSEQIGTYSYTEGDVSSHIDTVSDRLSQFRSVVMA